MPALWPDDTATTLDLRNRRLTEVPGLERCRQLQRAWLSGNRLTAFPRGLVGLPELTAVSIEGNPLDAIDEAVAAELSLSSIDLSHAAILTLPPSVARWPLQSLRLIGLPAGFAWEEALLRVDPSRLHSLSLGENVGVAGALGLVARFTELRVLHLNSCGLREVPPAFAALRHLETLSFFENELEALPEAVMALPSLRSLVVSKNPGTRRIKAALKKRGVGYTVS